MVQNGSSMSAPSYDLVAFGATSFVGKILCRYLWEEFGAQGEMKWARGRALEGETRGAAQFARGQGWDAAARCRRRR